MKATPEQIRQRFDHDVERFSHLETGQSSTIDARLVLELIAQAAAALVPHARSVLDVGCGAGNYTLLLLRKLPGLDVTLLDLSQPMLTRARERVQAEQPGTIETIQGDVREAPLGHERFDIILAAAVLHHLRTEAEWEHVFARLHASLRQGGALFVSDLIDHELPPLRDLMRQRYGEYLAQLRGADYRDHVLAYIEQEDSPRPLQFQLDLLRRVGFTVVEVLHKNACFAAYVAIKIAPC